MDVKPYVKARLSMNPFFNINDYELLVSGKLSDIKNPDSTVLVRRKNLLPGGTRIVEYVDGHSEIIQERWPLVK